MVRTSVPLLKPPEPETAWPIETGRVSIVQSKGARTSVLVRCSSVMASVALGTFEGVLGQFVGGLGVVVDLLGDELVGQQLLRAFEVALGLFQIQFSLIDVRQIRSAFLLKFLVVQFEQEVALLDAVADIDRQGNDFAIDLRPDGDLFRGPDFSSRRDGKIDAPESAESRWFADRAQPQQSGLSANYSTPSIRQNRPPR